LLDQLDTVNRTVLYLKVKIERMNSNYKRYEQAIVSVPREAAVSPSFFDKYSGIRARTTVIATANATAPRQHTPSSGHRLLKKIDGTTGAMQ
jgi:hypothetical protein